MTLCATTPADCPPPPTTPPRVGDYSGDATTTPDPTFLPDPTIRPHHPCTQEGYDATACQPAVTELAHTGLGLDLALVGVALIAAGAAARRWSRRQREPEPTSGRDEPPAKHLDDRIWTHRAAEVKAEPGVWFWWLISPFFNEGDVGRDRSFREQGFDVEVEDAPGRKFSQRLYLRWPSTPQPQGDDE